MLRNLERGATLIATGPWTNLALLEIARPGSLNWAPVVATGGWTGLATGLPRWGPEMDFNVQWDTRAAEVVAATADLTLVPLPVTLTAHLRAVDLPRLRASGPLGELLARQGEAHGHDFQWPRWDGSMRACLMTCSISTTTQWHAPWRSAGRARP
jgi:purine nucleosidase